MSGDDTTKAPAASGAIEKDTPVVEAAAAGSIVPAYMSPIGPVAEQRPHTVLFGKVDDQDRGTNPMVPPIAGQDPWYWLRDDERKAPDMLAHLHAENKWFEERTADINELRDTLYKEHISHIEETEMSAPYSWGPDYLYYWRTVAGQSYRIHCRVPKSEKAGGPAEEVLMDINKYAEGKKHCDVRQLEPSPDHKTILYSIDTTGNEVFAIKSLPNSQSPIEDVISEATGSIEWGADSSTFFYTTKDATLRPDKIWMHRVGTSQEQDILLHEENDTIYVATGGKTLCDRYFIVGSSSSETSEYYLIDIEKLSKLPPGSPSADVPKVLIRARQHGLRYDPNVHEDGKLIILTNADKAVNNKIMQASISAPGEWTTELVPHDPEVFLEDLFVFKSFLVVGGRQGGMTRVWTADLRGDKANHPTLNVVTVPDPVFSLELIGSHHKEYDAKTFRAVYSSLTTPDRYLDYDPFTHESAVVKEKQVGGGFNAADYVCERRFASAPDGVQVSMSLVYRRGLDLSQPQPTMLYGYGSYGICIDPAFATSYIPYIERGMVYVIAHIRGGGENGRAWYEIHGKYLTKRNTFSDFIACAEYLVKESITAPELLAIEGRSAGGLLIGSVLNMRPDLFKAAIAGVPFVDVMTTMSDPTIPLTTGEWEEWGNPNEHRYYDYMRSYSPMDNVRGQNYPNLLIAAGLHDPRVAYWEPAKWACKLRATKQNTNNAEVLVKMDIDAGHFSASDRYKFLKEKAIEQAWVVKHVLRRLK